MNTIDRSSSKTDDEENCALPGKAKKGKGKASHSKPKSCHGDKKKDMSKVKFFHCHGLGHVSTKCFLKNSSNKPSRGVTGGEALASQFELGFALLTCMVSSMMGSGASFHMIGNKGLLSNLEEKDL